MSSTTLQARLDQARARIDRRRCEAFIDYRPCVCGLDLDPVTLSSYNRLLAFESPFVVGGPIDAEALVVFIWIHHPAFGPSAAARRRVVRQVWRALHPRFPHLNAFFLLAAQLFPRLPFARLTVPTAAERFSIAAAQARHLVAEAIEDFPRPARQTEDEEGNPKNTITADGPKFALVAQLLNTFARTLGMRHAEAEALPMKRAVQLFRECIVSAGEGKGISLMHPEEARVWREFLDDPAAT